MREGVPTTTDSTPRPTIGEPRRTLIFPLSIGENSETDDNLTISNEFNGGRLAGARQLGPNEFELIIRPENEPPINDSAWYAFKVKNFGLSPREVTLHFTYDDAYARMIEEMNVDRIKKGKTPLEIHRYHPKLSFDGGKTWTPIDPARVQISPDPSQRSAVVKLPPLASGAEVIVAGQELVTTDVVENWASQLARKPFVHKSSAGRSTGGREILRLDIAEPGHETEKNRPYIFLISGFHPPESTGRMAFMAFFETLAGDSDLAKRFREKFDVVSFPVANPDGADLGHFRHSLEGRDPNRDWGRFLMTEPRAIRDAMRSMMGRRCAFGIDYHSTYFDVMYVQKHEKPGSKRDVIDAWTASLGRRLPGYRFDLDEVGLDQDDPSELGVSTNWMNQALDAPAVTYEVGDNTPRNQLREIAREAANALMENLLGI